jgi:asparagine synthase (glutamine-hydrolysing)
MCGIAGYLQLDGAPAAQVVVRRMTDAIAHRGPDGEGVWVSGPVGLGHRRLAVIDLGDGGRQPMQTNDGRWTITYNGELYNFAEIKTQLSALGERFVSTSDTEVMLKALARWGLAAVPKFNGMFAAAVWDARARELHLIRDRFGVKPLYWMYTGNTFLFGSEIKAILAHDSVQPELDTGGLREYLTFQNFLSSATLFRGIEMLPPGTTMTARPHQREFEAKSYYELNFAEPSVLKPQRELEHELDHLFRQAVSRQLVADVEVGSYLSGGIDSAAISVVASGEVRHLRTFTCGFDLSSASGLELYFDERPAAEMVSAQIQSEHYEMVLKAGDMERAVPSLVWHLEEPRVGQCYPNFYMSQLAAKFNKVVLAGTGGDEIFGGYTWRYLSAYGENDAELEQNAFATWCRLLPAHVWRRVMEPLKSSSPEPMDIFRSILPLPGKGAAPEERLNALLTFEAKTFLHGLLTVEDKVAMAHSLETRVPFLDNDLFEFASRLSVREKVGTIESHISRSDDLRRSQPGKQLLRKALSRYLPSEIVNREKQGFAAPDASWFKGQSIEYVRARVGNPKALIYEVLDSAEIFPLLEEHFQGIVNRRLLIWSLIYLEEVFRRWRLV